MRLCPTPGFALVVLVVLAACQPALNWREVHPEGGDVVALFPCKPEVEQRPGMGLAFCEAAERRFALSWADVPDATRVGAALRAMPQALTAKLGQPLPPAQVVQVPGMTPAAEAAQYRLTGARVAVFARGGRVYQLLMSGERDDATAWESFVGGLRLGS